MRKLPFRKKNCYIALELKFPCIQESIAKRNFSTVPLASLNNAKRGYYIYQTKGIDFSSFMLIKFSNKKLYYKIMEIKYNKNSRIITPLSPKLDEWACGRLFAELNSEDKNTALDLDFVQDCTIDFVTELLEFAKSKKISVFNIPAEIFVLFNVMNVDKNVQLYVTQDDFEENSRQLVNRKLAVV